MKADSKTGHAAPVSPAPPICPYGYTKEYPGTLHVCELHPEGTFAPAARPETPGAEPLSAEQFWPEWCNSLPVCGTITTPRVARWDCKCGTYPDNLGPCLEFEEGKNGRCPYCDHGRDCHHRTYLVFAEAYASRLRQELESAQRAVGRANEGLAWFAECVIRERGGTPDPEGWIHRAFECADARNEDLQALREQLAAKDADLERFKKWKDRIDTAWTAGMLALTGEVGFRIPTHQFITSLKVAMRQAESDFMDEARAALNEPEAGK